MAIRRRAGSNARLAGTALEEQARRLFAARVRESVARFPFYADVVRNHRGALPKPGEEALPEELPVWTRKLQREFFEQQPRPIDASYQHQTSGSTGTPVRFYITRESYEWRTAVSDRGYSWAGAEEGRRSVHIWAADEPTLKKSVHRWLQRRHYFDAFQQFGEEQKAGCVNLINRVKPAALVGYTSMLVALARYARDNPGALRWKAKTLVNAAEGLQPGQRALLQEHLVDEVFLNYGSREFMIIGMECAHHDGYHIASDNVFVEVVDDNDAPVSPGQAGRIVITDLHNAATPFIRYALGDVGSLVPPGEPCKCGLPFPRLATVDGRAQDVIHTPEGNTITALYVTYVMRHFLWVEGYQVVQNSPGEMELRLLTRTELTEENTAPILDMLREKLGASMSVKFTRVDELTRLPSGKVHLVASNVPKA